MQGLQDTVHLSHAVCMVDMSCGARETFVGLIYGATGLLYLPTYKMTPCYSSSFQDFRRKEFWSYA
jgi:hypothetical protein